MTRNEAVLVLRLFAAGRLTEAETLELLLNPLCPHCGAANAVGLSCAACETSVHLEPRA